jgi:hypothetical protein
MPQSMSHCGSSVQQVPPAVVHNAVSIVAVAAAMARVAAPVEQMPEPTE